MPAPTIDELFQSFKATTEGNQRADGALRRLLSSADKLPEWQGPVPLIPLDGLEIRLDYIQRIEKCWKEEFVFLTRKDAVENPPSNDLEMSAFLVIMDLDQLRFQYQHGYATVTSLMEMIQGPPLALKMSESS